MLYCISIAAITQLCSYSFEEAHVGAYTHSRNTYGVTLKAINSALNLKLKGHLRAHLLHSYCSLE